MLQNIQSNKCKKEQGYLNYMEIKLRINRIYKENCKILSGTYVSHFRDKLSPK